MKQPQITLPTNPNQPTIVLRPHTNPISVVSDGEAWVFEMTINGLMYRRPHHKRILMSFPELIDRLQGQFRLDLKVPAAAPAPNEVTS